LAPAVPLSTSVGSLVILSVEERPVSSVALVMTGILALSEVTMFGLGAGAIPSPR
jgi:hypothetical protein